MGLIGPLPSIDSGHDEPVAALVSVASVPQCGPQTGADARHVLGYRDDDVDRLPNTYIYDDDRSYAAMAYRGRRACT
jgi:hypothetical protein